MKPQFEEEQTVQLPSKRTNNDLQNTAQKTKGRKRQTPLKPWGERIEANDAVLSSPITYNCYEELTLIL